MNGNYATIHDSTRFVEVVVPWNNSQGFGEFHLCAAETWDVSFYVYLSHSFIANHISPTTSSLLEEIKQIVSQLFDKIIDKKYI